MSVVGLSGHPNVLSRCLLSGVKRTSQFEAAMSAYDPKRTCGRKPVSLAASPASAIIEASRGEGCPRAPTCVKMTRALIGKRGRLSTIKCTARKPVAAGEW
jgi:hypothetical protein